MKVIAISGKSGSGKSTLAKFLNENLPNSISINYDVLNKNLMEKDEHIKYAITLFSENILNEMGMINKKLLADIIYCNSNLYYAWVGHMLRACDSEVNTIIKNTNHDYIIIEHANIMYSRFCKTADYIILATASFSTRLKRLKQREGTEKKLLKLRDKNCHIVLNYDIKYNGKNEIDILNEIKKLDKNE